MQQQKIAINIFGSCVSRDVLEFDHKRHFNLLRYFARPSIFSSVATPVHIDPLQLQITSNFQKQAVLHDFRKDVFSILGSQPGEVLLLDLIDERLPLAKIGDSVVTYSNELAVSGYLEQPLLLYKHKSYKWGLVPPFFLHRVPDWKIGGESTIQKLQAFCFQLKKVYRVDQIILHEVYFSNRYLDENGISRSFPIHHLRNNDRNNAMFSYFYRTIIDTLPGIRRIAISENFQADANHKWGLSPMHFQKQYYEAVIKQLYALLHLDVGEV